MCVYFKIPKHIGSIVKKLKCDFASTRPFSNKDEINPQSQFCNIDDFRIHD
jgi:hypothetical protein